MAEQLKQRAAEVQRKGWLAMPGKIEGFTEAEVYTPVKTEAVLWI